MKPLYEQPMLCPLEPNCLCPLSIPKIRQGPDEDIEAAVAEKNVLMNQLPQDINRILAVINRELSQFYNELQRYGVPRTTTQWLFISIVTYVLRNAGSYTGNIEQRTAQILGSLRRDTPLLFNTLRGFGVPVGLIDEIFSSIIRTTLRTIDERPGPSPGPGPRPPGPGPSPAPAWSNWEDLGGVLTSAPAVASWQQNRLDVFGRGQNDSLWHRWWDGSSWSQWEDLGGVLTSAPAAASWGPNRIDVFGVGQNQSLWHKWWDGNRWSQWEDLGGVLTSAPAAVSWGPNRIDVFGRGQNNSLWHKWWDGNRWSQWEDLGGGSITSGPAAASTGSNRLEVFARGARNELLYRTWNGNRWSSWESLGGVITSEPAAVSWGDRRLDVFARGQDSHLWHIWRS